MSEFKRFTFPNLVLGSIGLGLLYISGMAIGGAITITWLFMTPANSYLRISDLTYDSETDIVELVRSPTSIIPFTTISELVNVETGDEPCNQPYSSIFQPKERDVFRAPLQRYFSMKCQPNAGIYHILSVWTFSINGIQKRHAVKSPDFVITPEQAARFARPPIPPPV